jgi:hypothetical protein
LGAGSFLVATFICALGTSLDWKTQNKTVHTTQTKYNLASQSSIYRKKTKNKSEHV